MNKILVVDDLETNRRLLRQILLAIGEYEVVEANSGREAIILFENENPDLILMDIMMPDIDGCQATTLIKEKMGETYTPIIFVTALNSEESLTTALASGGDDFISKPINIDVLKSKINVHLRIRELNQQLNVKNNILQHLNQKLKYEQSLIEHFFESAIQQSFLDGEIIRYHMSSLSAFNGDLLLSERAPHGGLYLIMGDFTGHGLTAAMGTLPVAMIFFKMTAESSSVSDIAREINSQLYKLMPSCMFFVASILELSESGDVMSIWIGGSPELYWLSQDGEFKGAIKSEHMPLGILDDDEFNASVQMFNMELGDTIYLYSDGVVETKNSQGELFGNKRLKETLISGGSNRFDTVLNRLKLFNGEDNQADDTTLVELHCQSIPKRHNNKKNIVDENALTWDISVSLSADDMREVDSIRKLTAIVNSMPHMSMHKDNLYLILFEIYSNAIDHSILNIENTYKIDEEHFVEYYHMRDQALLKLEKASIKFDFNFSVIKGCYHLKIKVRDSGCGYQKNHFEKNDDILYGRGLSIVRGLCEEMSFSEKGKVLTVLYKF